MKQKGIGDLKVFEFLKKNKNIKVSFVLNCLLVKLEEDEINPFFHCEIEIYIEGTNENILFERATEKMISKQNKTVQFGSLNK